MAILFPFLPPFSFFHSPPSSPEVEPGRGEDVPGVAWPGWRRKGEQN